MDRGARQTTVHGVAESDPTECLSLSLVQFSAALLASEQWQA